MRRCKRCGADLEVEGAVEVRGTFTAKARIVPMEARALDSWDFEDGTIEVHALDWAACVRCGETAERVQDLAAEE